MSDSKKYQMEIVILIFSLTFKNYVSIANLQQGSNYYNQILIFYGVA